MSDLDGLMRVDLFGDLFGVPNIPVGVRLWSSYEDPELEEPVQDWFRVYRVDDQIHSVCEDDGTSGPWLKTDSLWIDLKDLATKSLYLAWLAKKYFPAAEQKDIYATGWRPSNDSTWTLSVHTEKKLYQVALMIFHQNEADALIQAILECNFP